MRILRLLIVLLALPLVAAHAQETEPPEGTRINGATVSGLDLSRLSPGLQEEIGKLAGSPLNRQQLRDLAARIEAEQPRYVAAVRISQDPDGAARVVFVLARMSDQEHETNINTQYIVESVEIKGVRERDLDSTLVADLHALAGRQLDPDDAERLETRLKDALPGYDIDRRTTKGSQPRTIKVIFDAHRAEWSRWLRFEPIDANAIYHSEQGWGFEPPDPRSGAGTSRSRCPSRGTSATSSWKSTRASACVSKRGRLELNGWVRSSSGRPYDQTWRDSTIAALPFYPRVPPLYRNRMSVTPLLKFAITRQVTVGGGVRITELDAIDGSDLSQMANAGIGWVSFSQRAREKSGTRHDAEASFTVRAGTRALESDLVYERYLGQADYSFRLASHRVRVSGMAGSIRGNAPLFERFTLGDSQTLRGWDKYDIAPAGGDRMFHTSLEYTFHGLGMFLDAGSVWDTGVEKRVRVSTGITYNPGPVFMTVGFPLNTDEFGAVFTMGLRFPTPVAGIKKY